MPLLHAEGPRFRKAQTHCHRPPYVAPLTPTADLPGGLWHVGVKSWASGNGGTRAGPGKRWVSTGEVETSIAFRRTADLGKG
jgi:hypothetical protein